MLMERIDHRADSEVDVPGEVKPARDSRFALPRQFRQQHGNATIQQQTRAFLVFLTPTVGAADHDQGNRVIAAMGDQGRLGVPTAAIHRVLIAPWGSEAVNFGDPSEKKTCFNSNMAEYIAALTEVFMGIRAGHVVIAGDHDHIRVRQRLHQTLELQEGVDDGRIRGADRVKHVPRNHDEFRAQRDRLIDDLPEHVRNVRLALVDASRSRALELPEAEMQVGEMQEPHSRNLRAFPSARHRMRQKL